MITLNQSICFIPLLAFLTSVTIITFFEANGSGVKIKEKPSTVFLTTNDMNYCEAHVTVQRSAEFMEKNMDIKHRFVLGAWMHLADMEQVHGAMLARGV